MSETLSDHMTFLVTLNKEYNTTIARLEAATNQMVQSNLGALCLLRAYELEYGQLPQETLQKHGQKIADEFNAILPKANGQQLAVPKANGQQPAGRPSNGSFGPTAQQYTGPAGLSEQEINNNAADAQRAAESKQLLADRESPANG